MDNADPRIGTWRLNVAKSKFSPGLLTLMKVTPPKDETIVYQELGTDEFEMTITGTQTDGKPIAAKSTLPRQGGVVKIQQGPFPEAVTLVTTRIDSNNSYLTYMLNGKQFLLGQSIVSKNGRQMTTTIKGADPQGKPFEYVAVFDRQ